MMGETNNSVLQVRTNCSKEATAFGGITGFFETPWGIFYPVRVGYATKAVHMSSFTVWDFKDTDMVYPRPDIVLARTKVSIWRRIASYFNISKR